MYYLIRKKLITFIIQQDQHQCTDSGLKSLEKKRKPLFFKQLKKVWDHFEGKYSESDTLLIDDQPYKALSLFILGKVYTNIQILVPLKTSSRLFRSLE